MTISLRSFFILAFLFCCALKSHAEGSKELAANGGNRVFWRSSTAPTPQFPYPYLGIIKVYARAGESIYLGSSAQGFVGSAGTTGTINWRAPNGATGSSGNSTTVGRIQNRAEEVAGPRLVTGGPGPGYDPYIVTVGAGQEGVWEITFIGSHTNLSGAVPPLTQASADWVQPPSSIYITAFDVSIRNAANTAFVPGRAFLNMFAGNTTNVADNYGSFNGVFHILTKDGYIYTVNANGMQGVAFDFFVNNKGFRDAAGNASYKSVTGIGTTPANIPVHNPTTPDDATNVTHKLFLNTPATDLPPVAAAPGGGTDWLLSIPLVSSLSNFAFTGTEGTANMAGAAPLGGSFAFSSTTTGSFVISLDVDQNGSFNDVRDRMLTGFAAAGANTVAWDGLDGEDVPIPGGMVFQPGTIRIEMLGGEVHFPLLDVERNPNGIIVTRVTGAGLPDDMLHWDDSDIPPVAPGSSNPIRNLSGQSSATNGHIWSNNFGNDNGMDSWAYIPSAPLTNSAPLMIRAADLEIVSITPTPAVFCQGAQVAYQVTVRNNGPSPVVNAPFTFTYPANLTGVTVTHTVVTDTFLVSSQTNVPGQYSALITTGNTAEAIFTITGTAATIPPGGNLITTASIMRTADVTDPDATNPDAAPPTDPQAECDAAPSGPGCNNIKTNTVTVSATITNNTISTAQQICAGATPTALTGSVPGGGNGTFTYLWESSTTSATDGFGAAAGVNNGQDYTPASLTATTWFRRTVTSGCILPSAAVEITVEALPAAPVAAATQPTCTEATGSITITAVAGLTYSINGTDYQAGNVFSSLAPGTYQVTGRSTLGCTSTATAVIIDPQPATPAAPVATPTQPTCAVATGTITVTAVAGLTYSINGTDYQAGVTFSNVAPGTYQVTARNTEGCTSAPTQIVINAQPTAPAAPVATPTQPTCAVATGTITVTAVADLTYSINGTDYQAGNTFSNVAAGTYQVTARNTEGCTSAPTQIVINAQPTAPAAPVATPTQPTCAVATGTITVTTAAGLTYSINGTDYQAGATFSNVAPGTYQVTARNTEGCTSAPTQIVINAQPAAPAAPAATPTQPTCAVATGTITVTASAGLTYSINGTDYQAGNTFSNVAPGTYQVTARNSSGCTSTATPITINAAPSAPAAPGVANVTYCVGDAATALTATGTQIKWYAAATGGAALSQPVIPLTTAAGTTTYWASQTNAAGCEGARAAVTVTVFAKPALQVTSSTADMTVGDARRELTGNVASGTFTGPGVVAENNRYYFNPATAGPGLHSITYSASGGGTCTSTLTFSLRVLPEEADLVVSVQAENKPAGVGDPFTYTITAGNNGPGTATNVVVTDPLPATVEYVSHNTNNGTATYTPASNSVTWNIGTLPPNIIQTLVITVKPTQLGVVENTASISSSQTDNTPSNNTAVAAKEIVGLKIPNVITPNGDGYNDRFVIKGLDLFPQNQLTIINRWGNHVYEQKNYSNNWDGKGLLEGTYFYILQLTDNQGRKHDYKGYLMINR